jgi:hypothetical protein
LDKDQAFEVDAKSVNVSRKRSHLLFENNKGGKKSSRGLFDLSKALKRRSENLMSARWIFENRRRPLKGLETVTRVTVLYRADEP